MSNWIPVSERLPEVFEHVLIWGGGLVRLSSRSDTTFIEATHWQPLPAGPQAEARRAAGQARWAGVSKRQRSRQMRAVRASGGGRKRERSRCWCGRYTLHTARQRNFDCCKRAGVYPGRKP